MPGKSKNDDLKKQRRYYTLHPWQCRHYAEHSEISAYVEASGEYEVVAIIRPTSGASSEALATFIVNLINDNQNNGHLLSDAMATLQLILEEDRLTFSSEQAADAIVNRIRKRMG